MNKKIVSLVVGVAAVFAFASVASAATVAELQAMIAQLQAQLASLGGTGTGSATTAYTFTSNLTVGSRGADVEALQQILIDEGYLTAVTAPTGYFGAATKAALAKWQAANGVAPAAGYFGPLTRAAINAKAPTTGGTTGGTTTTTTTPGITTPGVEGTLTVSTNPIPSAGLTVREGDVNKGVLGLKLEAKLSDINVQRVKVDLGDSTIIYNKLFNRISLVDDSGKVLAESALNSSTVVKEGTTYYITLAGFNYIVPKDSTKVLTLRLDAMGSIDSTYDNAATYGLAIPANGVRGVDGAGLNQTGPSSALSRRTVTIGASSLADAATLTMSISANTPVANNVIAADGTNSNEKDGVTLAVFDVRAQKDDVKITDATATILKTGNGGATATTAYLYVDGRTDAIGTASVHTSTGVATFSTIDYTIPAGTTKTFTVKVDVRSANGTASNLSVIAVDLTSENSSGTSIVETGSVMGNTMSVLNEGLEIALVGTPTITKTESSLQNNVSTSTVTATFNVALKAVGDNIYLGTVASGTPMLATTTTFWNIYKDGAALAAQAVASSTSYEIPTGGISTGIGTNSFYIPENNTVMIPVTFSFQGRVAATGAQLSFGNYSVGLSGLRWSADAGATSVTSTFMDNTQAWKTTAVSLP